MLKHAEHGAMEGRIVMLLKGNSASGLNAVRDSSGGALGLCYHIAQSHEHNSCVGTFSTWQYRTSTISIPNNAIIR